MEMLHGWGSAWRRRSGAWRSGARRSFYLVWAATLYPACVSAHEFWLAPSTYAAAAGDTVSIRAFVGSGFRGEAKPFGARRVQRFELRAAARRDLSRLGSNGGLVYARFIAPDGGGALVAYQSDFASIELPGPRFEQYLAAEGLDGPRTARARTQAEDAPRRERYARCAKTWIAGKEPSRAEQVIGMPLEIVALADPAAADRLPLQVLYGGKPLAAALVRAWNTTATLAASERDSVPPACSSRTDAHGIVTLAIDHPGEWLVNAVHMVASGDPDADWESYWASLTFARPAKRAPRRRNASSRRGSRRSSRRQSSRHGCATSSRRSAHASSYRRGHRTRPRWLGWIAGLGWAGLLLASAPRPARAHAEPYSYVDLRLDGAGIEGEVTAHGVDLAGAIGLATPDSLRSARFVERHAGELHAAIVVRLHLEADGAAVHPTWTSFQIVPERRAVSFRFRVPEPRTPRSVHLLGPLFASDPAHETYFNVYASGAVRHQDLLEASHTESTYASDAGPDRRAVVRTFLAAGVHQIFIGPDHILFVIGLLLLGGGVRRLLKIVTAFTIAHSITLALAATGAVSPSARVVEPAIALSIVYVGADNLLRGRRRRDTRALAAAGFGLVHGFGFASVLGEMGLPSGALAGSLFAFNAGVEIGQACIVLAVAPLLAVLRAHRPAGVRRAVIAGSAFVLVAGAYWFVQRAFGL